jgi:uncharacterized protein
MLQRFIEPGGVANVQIKKGKKFKIINTFGHQVVDVWAFNSNDMSESLSMHHSRSALYKMWFQPDDTLVSTLFEPIIKIISDTSNGGHDTLHAACSKGSYKFYNALEPISNCTDNLKLTLDSYNFEVNYTPCPWNLFEHAFIQPNGRLEDKPSTAQPGDFVELEAQKDLIVVCSACPSRVGNISASDPKGATIEY